MHKKIEDINNIGLSVKAKQKEIVWGSAADRTRDLFNGAP